MRSGAASSVREFGRSPTSSVPDATSSQICQYQLVNTRSRLSIALQRCQPSDQVPVGSSEAHSHRVLRRLRTSSPQAVAVRLAAGKPNLVRLLRLPMNRDHLAIASPVSITHSLLASDPLQGSRHSCTGHDGRGTHLQWKMRTPTASPTAALPHTNAPHPSCCSLFAVASAAEDACTRMARNPIGAG